MNACAYCKAHKDTVERRFGKDYRGITQMDLYLCDECAEELSHFGPFSKVLKRTELNFGYMLQKPTQLAVSS